jgi:hypothetical protein
MGRFDSLDAPLFLEKWGVVFVSVGGLWMLSICVAMLTYLVKGFEDSSARARGKQPEPALSD